MPIFKFADRRSQWVSLDNFFLGLFGIGPVQCGKMRHSKGSEIYSSSDTTIAVEKCNNATF